LGVQHECLAEADECICVIFVQVLKMEEDRRRAAELHFQADKQAKEAALAAAAEKRIVADMVRDAVARGAVKGADALAAAKEERAVAELVRGAVARGALKAAEALAAQDHPAPAAKVCVLLSLRRLVKHD